MSDEVSSEVGERLRVFRESKRMTQAQMADALGGTASGLKQNERGATLPNSKVLIGLRNLGLNVDWLLSGEGPMLRVDLRKPTSPNINVDALIKAFEVMTQTATPGETPPQTARKAVEFYMYLIDKGMITPDGVGDGDMSNAA